MQHHAFIHSGAAGDLIYALPAMVAKAQRVTGDPRFKLVLGTKTPVHHPFTEQYSANMIPLLEIQPYIESVERQSSGSTWNDDCDPFRDLVLKRHVVGKTITAYVCDVLGVDHSCSFKPWLRVDHPMHVDGKPVVINRTARFTNAAFPWKKIMKKYGAHAVFVGTDVEWSNFKFCYGDIPYCPTDNALELARMIAGCRLFIGNQSFAYSIAEGLKQNTIQEVSTFLKDCIWERPNAWFGLHSDPEMPDLSTL